MEIKRHTVEEIYDPTGILEGERYEIILDIEVDEDDDLYSEQGLYIKLIFAVESSTKRIAQYQIFERVTDKYIDLALDDEELEEITHYCIDVVNSL